LQGSPAEPEAQASEEVQNRGNRQPVAVELLLGQRHHQQKPNRVAAKEQSWPERDQPTTVAHQQPNQQPQTE